MWHGRGSLSVRQYTNTVTTLYSIDMQYFSTQGKSNSYLFSILKFLMMAATVKRLRFGWTLWPASLMLKPWLSTWSTTVAQISLEITVLLLLSPPPPSSSPLLPPPCHPLPCPLPTLTLTPLLLWLLICSKFSIVHQTKQRLKALFMLQS